jgi:hypothetical protein
VLQRPVNLAEHITVVFNKSGEIISAEDSTS